MSTPSLTVSAPEMVSAGGGTVDEEGNIVLHAERPASHERLSFFNCNVFGSRASKACWWSSDKSVSLSILEDICRSWSVTPPHTHTSICVTDAPVIAPVPLTGVVTLLVPLESLGPLADGSGDEVDDGSRIEVIRIMDNCSSHPKWRWCGERINAKVRADESPAHPRLSPRTQLFVSSQDIFQKFMFICYQINGRSRAVDLVD